MKFSVRVSVGFGSILLKKSAVARNDVHWFSCCVRQDWRSWWDIGIQRCSASRVSPMVHSRLDRTIPHKVDLWLGDQHPEALASMGHFGQR